MSSSYGEHFRLTIFGESHSEAIGVTMEGLPAGTEINEEHIAALAARRAPGKSPNATARREADKAVFVCGVKNGRACGSPITALIYNTNQHSKDYAALADTPRPGHADYPAEVKYGGFQDKSGGGHFSGRLTAPLCIAGAICMDALKKEGIEVFARIASIGGIEDPAELTESCAHKEFPVVTDEIGERMQQCIQEARAQLDSVGGVVECKVLGLPAGLGDPMFDGMENRIARIVFGIPAVKGLQFGDGFAAAQHRGSENNDAYCLRDGKIVTETNHCGGILGGITNGMPLCFRAAFKPTPSIAQKQQTVNLASLTEQELEIHGRHDPCVVQRAVPVVEAAAAIAVYDALLQRRKEQI